MMTIDMLDMIVEIAFAQNAAPPVRVVVQPSIAAQIHRSHKSDEICSALRGLDLVVNSTIPHFPGFQVERDYHVIPHQEN